ncbi:hypothetical protein SAMN05216582_12071 [Selenomonas ruminantium]|uniref:DUF3887 domain-containing protein n=1 Tax=Selenomonas ruminantium TaxID=971 RepID=A0A1M6VTY6_SELRU|nr:hypothetical protein [Selenomonas ruminantium]SHK84864.1 hypothetical protein SAMN05216582_12071 [Selenomonas ruminantium]
MRKKILAVLFGVMLGMSAVTMAATPEAEIMSVQQAKAMAWTDTMLVKNKPADTLKLMSSEAQKEITDKKITEIGKDISKNLGKYQGARLAGWSCLDQFQLVYFMKFEKEPLVRCVFFFNEKGEILNFALQPLQINKQEKKDDNKKENKKK